MGQWTWHLSCRTPKSKIALGAVPPAHNLLRTPLAQPLQARKGVHVNYSYTGRPRHIHHSNRYGNIIVFISLYTECAADSHELVTAGTR
jgi:hypothetical protein